MANLSSTQSGNWSSASTWGGTAPSSSSNIVINAGHTVVVDNESTVDGVVINDGGVLRFNPNGVATIQSTKNIVVYGKLEMKPFSASIIHTIKFININEDTFVGGGMTVLATDIGLWVMGGVMGELTGGGELDLLGTQKSTFVNAFGTIASGATTITLASTPVGWQVGDPIVVTPTESPNTAGTVYMTAFEERTITAITGATITLSSPLSRAHPKVNNMWTAEVINLIRNVRVEGTVTGKSHIFIHSNGTQNIRNVQIRYMGPRRDRIGTPVKEFVSGRYGIHFHHCMVGSTGSLVDGCIIRNTDSHCYVPHVSDGITMSNNATYDTLEMAFWWDPGETANSTLWDRNIVAKCSYVPGSADQNAEEAPTLSSSGFLFSRGSDNVATNNIVCGVLGEQGGYNWEATVIEGVWVFRDNLAHNNSIGLRLWQNSTRNHTVENYSCYNNELGVFHGAYANSYSYRGGTFFANTFSIHASSLLSSRVRLEDITFDGNGEIEHCVYVNSSPIPAPYPTFLRNLNMKGFTVSAVRNDASNELKCIDIIQCTATGGPLFSYSSTATADEVVRIQPVSGTPTRVTKAGTTNIAAFAPTLWGTGKGLLGEYFNSTNFTNIAFSRIDSIVGFQEWGTDLMDYRITNIANTSVRWTGQIQPQYTEPYVFSIGAGGGVRLYVNNTLILNQFGEDNYPDGWTSSSINLTAGQKYDIKLEYYNQDERAGVNLYWQSTSLPMELIPQTQSYAPAGTINKPPVANAGANISLTLPANSTTLNGTGSSDDSAVVSYTWSRISGPNTPSITGSTTSIASISGLVAGTYIYRLTVADAAALTNFDDVQITVSTSNIPPIARAGNDIIIQLPTNEVILNGSASTDGDGTIATYKWSKLTGPVSYMLMDENSATAMAHNLTQGEYVFRLTVTDNLGATSTDDIMVGVQAAAAANQPPVVTVGANPLVILPTNSATLSATSTDDGSVVGNRWTKIAGPTQFTITNANALTTTVTNLVAGVYTFRITATDNKGLTASKDLSVIVVPSNGITIQGRYNIIIQ